MTNKAGIFGIGLAVILLSAHANAQTYASMAVPGSHNGWATTPSMTYSAPYWIGTQTLSSASGEFKFTANNSWTTNWGGEASISRVPASASASHPSDINLRYSNLTPGTYRFTFNPSTLEFLIEWAGASPLPVPAISSLAMVGDFNSWTSVPNSVLTNHPGNTNLWSRSITLETPTSFMFRRNGTDDWGAAAPLSLAPPVSNAYACGSANFTLTQFNPGNFLVLFNASNTSFSITQTSTTDVVNAVTVLGSFVGTNNPPPNMVRLGNTLWESTHDFTNRGNVTLRFSVNNGARTWGATNATPLPLPASGILATGLTTFATVSGVTNGRYRITFDHVTGAFSIQQLYTVASGINLIKNSGFETTVNGYADQWNGYQSWTKTPQDGVPPHSGQQSGAIHPKLFSDWTDYASYSQTVSVDTGRTYRASAWIRITSGWTASTMQLKVEWRNQSQEPLGGDAIVTFTPDSAWRYFSVLGTPPAGTKFAHIVVLCSGSGTTGYMCVDDVEMIQIPPRTQNFDSWGTYSSMGQVDAPDGWTTTSGMTVYNVPPGRPPAGVFISQYVEGTGNNKAIEIYNGTLSNLDLSAGPYVLQQYDNGATTPSATIALSSVVSPGSCLVVARPSIPSGYAPDPAIQNVPTLQTNKLLTFNGDDVIVLRKGTNIVDRIGQVSTNAVGSIWSRTTTDRTLTRNQTIFTGTLTSVTTPFSQEEWTSSSKDSFGGLGTHSISYIDPSEPYTPAGFSLLLNTNATLMSGELSGGIGDITFWYRTESMAPLINLSIESSVSADGPWTTNGTLSAMATTNFHYAVFSVNSPGARFARFRDINSGTNRFRLDEIILSPYSTAPRLETFSAWTLPAYEFPGTYSQMGWTLADASITTNGTSRVALLSQPSSTISSPPYGDGVGEVVFWASPAASNTTAYLNLQSSVDGGTTWVTQNNFKITSASNNIFWLYLTNNPSQIRIGFNPAYSPVEVLLDDIEVRLPALYLNQDFNAWPTKPSYSGGISSFQGWTVNDCMVDAQDAYDGNVARLSTTYASAWIQSPYLPDGVGSIRFQLNKATTTVNPVISVEVSSNAISWTPIATVTSTVPGYTAHSFFYSDTSNHYVRFRHSAGNAITPVDNIQLTAPQPRPEVSIFSALSPPAPTVDDSPYLTADVISQFGASVISVTGVYSIATNSWVSVAMSPVSYGSYASVSPIPAQAAGTMLRSSIQVQYAGIGAAPASTGFSTNQTSSAIQTNFVSSIPKGNVWINEISYYLTLLDPVDLWDAFEDHEFIELCGVSGTTISNWTIQLVFGSDSDVVKNGGSNVYASYSITNTFSNTTNGFGFYVLGDSGLTKANGNPIDKTLSILVPSSVDPAAAANHNHMHNSRGVIRLLDEYSRTVYSVSYGGTVSGSNPSGSQSGSTSNSVSLRNTGSTFDDFTWGSSPLSIGTVNGGQTLVAVSTNGLAEVFHIPSYVIDSSVIQTNMRTPVFAAHSDNMKVYYGYAVSAGYGQPAGILHFRDDDGAWHTAGMAFLEGSQDSSANVFSVGTIPAYTNSRGSTLQYVIEALVSKSNIGPTFLGAGTTNAFALFGTLDEAKASPFEYAFSVPSIYSASFDKISNKWVVATVGNDPNDPYKTFKVYSSTNLLSPLATWKTNTFTVTTDYLGQITFHVPVSNNIPVNYYRFDPTW